MLPFRRKNKEKKADVKKDAAVESKAEIKDAAVEKKPGKSWFKRLSGGLAKTRARLGDGIANVLLGQREINSELLESLTDSLVSADIGVQTAEHIIAQAKKELSRSQTQDSAALLSAIKEALLQILSPYQEEFLLPKEKNNSLLFIGVNGAGKTTTIAKMAHRLKKSGKKVILAAGDTFRAAAVEQLQAWGERNNAPVIAQKAGADSAAVIFDAMQACKARDYDVLLADTAGRLHTQTHLLDELAKVKRVMGKFDETAPQKTLLVLDATSGQNALVQAKQFHQAMDIDGIVLTKLDGSAKGGIIFAICHQLKLPIYFIGVGEDITDLQPFQAEAFIEALFDQQ
jgi:fused signal recognition particle receptor